MKKKYLYGRAGLDYWGIPFFRGTVEAKNTKIEKEEVFFCKIPSTLRASYPNIHSCVIKNAERYTEGNVCTLPLLFIQASNFYHFRRQILLGMQICAFHKNGYPLCTLKRLENCAERLVGIHGREKTLEVVKYVREGSRSPMESILAMFLLLPNSMGGFGFQDLQLNVRIESKNTGRTFYADLLIPSANLIIEYDSFEHHNSASSFSKDARRAAILEAEGYQILSVKPSQVYDLRSFTVLVKNIASRVGKKIQIRTTKFIPAFAELRALLRQSDEAFAPITRLVQRHELPELAGVEIVYRKYEQEWREHSRIEKEANHF